MSDIVKMVAFAIGVGDAKPLPYLPGAVNGARQFHEWASKLGYKSHLVIDDDPSNPVTIDRLNREFLSELPKKDDPPIDRLVIYFAGHGLIRDAEEGLWLLSDWRIQMRAVAVELLKRRLYRFNVGQIAIFADSCRVLPADIDAADLTTDGVLGLGPYDRNDPPIDKFIAAQDGSATFMVPGDTPEEDRCLFSGVLMEGLWGLNQGAFSKYVSGKVTSSSLGTFLKEEVPKRAAQYERKLSPSVSPTFPEGKNIYFEDGSTINRPSFPPWPPPPPSTRITNDPTGPLPRGTGPRGRFNFEASVGRDTDSSVGENAPEVTPWRQPESRVEQKPNAELLLLEKLRNQSRPEKFETTSGFAVEGGLVRNLWTPADVFSESHGAANWWRIGQRTGYQLLRSAPVLIEFEDGPFGAVTALPMFITAVLREPRGVTGLIYRNINAPEVASAAAENAVALLESGTLRAGAATDLAADIRQFKHADPVLGVISAYLYDSIGDVESIRRMAYFYVMNGQPIPYDIALMGQLRGERRPDGLLSVLVPAVAESKPRTKGEKEHEWTYSATREVIGEVGGFWPWMRQGWAFLDDAAADGSHLIVRGLADLTSNLTNARFATLDVQGGQRLIKVCGLASHR